MFFCIYQPDMILFKKAADLHKYIDGQRKNGMKIAFVPTMGALHNGHTYLVQQAQRGQTITVCSIFVNPVQFNDPADFKKYPVTIEKDILSLESIGCDVLFFLLYMRFIQMARVTCRIMNWVNSKLFWMENTGQVIFKVYVLWFTGCLK